jgi:hypothetical protein
MDQAGISVPTDTTSVTKDENVFIKLAESIVVHSGCRLDKLNLTCCLNVARKIQQRSIVSS